MASKDSQAADVPAVSPSIAKYMPPRVDLHEEEMAKREAARRAKRPLLLDCLDPSVAKAHEDRKEVWEWRVQVKLFVPAKGRAQAFMKPYDEQVVAQNDQDAWALFCDKIEKWPSRRDSNPTITKLKKRTLRADDVLVKSAE